MLQLHHGTNESQRPRWASGYYFEDTGTTFTRVARARITSSVDPDAPVSLSVALVEHKRSGAADRITRLIEAPLVVLPEVPGNALTVDGARELIAALSELVAAFDGSEVVSA